MSGSKALVQRPAHADIPVIVVNCGHNGERQRFTLAHELAHVVLRFETLSEADQEKAADRFAGAFLMAGDMLRRVLGAHRTFISLGELAELKKVFKVSVASLVVRCSHLGVLTKAGAGRLWAQINKRGWNGPSSKEPYGFQQRFGNAWNAFFSAPSPKVPFRSPRRRNCSTSASSGS